MFKSLSRLALGRGVFGGSRPWLIVGMALTGMRLLARLARKEPEVVYCDVLESGHRLVVSHLTRDEV